MKWIERMKAELIDEGYSMLLENFNHKYFLSKGLEYLHFTTKPEFSFRNIRLKTKQ